MPHIRFQSRVPLLLDCPAAMQDAVRYVLDGEYECEVDGRGLDILERVAVRNPSDQPFVSSTGGALGPMGLLRFSVPRGAYDLTLDDTLRATEFIPVDRGFGSLLTVPPGGIDVTFAYRVPYAAQEYELSLSAVYPTDSLWLLVPERLSVSSAELQPRETIAIGRQRYQVLVADDLPGGGRATVRLSGLPFTPRPWLLDDSVLRALAAALAGLGVVGAGLYAWRHGERPALSTES